MTEMLVIEEAAKRLNVKRSQLYRQIELGRFPHVRVGRYIRIPWPDVLEYLSQGAFGGQEKARTMNHADPFDPGEVLEACRQGRGRDDDR